MHDITLYASEVPLWSVFKMAAIIQDGRHKRQYRTHVNHYVHHVDGATISNNNKTNNTSFFLA